MAKLKKPIEETVWLESKINGNIEVFDTLPSQIGFDNFQFANRIKEEIAFIGLEPHEFCQSVYIKKDRMKKLLKGQTKFEYNEIKEITKRLSF